MLRSAGAGDTSDLIARAIDAWRTRDQADQSASPVQQPTSQPAANAAARQANAPPPKDDNFRSFTDLRQLAQVPGMTPEVLDAILPLATVFGDDKVNALTASADVLAALPNVGPGQVSAFLGARDRSGLAGDRLLQMLGPAKDYVKAEGRPAAAVILTALLPDGYTAAAKAVVTVLPDDKQPYRVLAWTPLRVSARGRARMAERLEEDR
jgi:type II secretory pathway component PulK